MNDNMNVSIDELLENTLTSGRSIEDELIDAEEGDEDPIEHATEDRDPVLKCMEDKALEFLARFNKMDKALTQVDLPPGKAVAKAVLAGTIEKEAALSWLTRFTHQLSKVALFELYRRQKAAERRSDQARLPTRDRFTQSLTLQAMIKNLPRRIEEDRREENALETASETEITWTLHLRQAELRTMHSEVFRLCYGQYPAQALGFISVEVTEGQWVEIESFDDALAIFSEQQECKAEERANRDKNAARGILAAFA